MKDIEWKNLFELVNDAGDTKITTTKTVKDIQYLSSRDEDCKFMYRSD